MDTKVMKIGMLLILVITILLLSIHCVPYHTRLFKTTDNLSCFNGWYISTRVFAYEVSTGQGVTKIHNYHFYSFASLNANEYRAIPNKSEFEARINKMELNVKDNTYIGDNPVQSFDTTGDTKLLFEESKKDTKENFPLIPKEVNSVTVVISCSFKHKITGEVKDSVFNFTLKRYEKTVWGLLTD